MTNNQLVDRIIEIVSELLIVAQKQDDMIKTQKFHGITHDYVRSLVTEAESLNGLIAKRSDMHIDVSQTKFDTLKKLYSKLSNVLEENRLNIIKIVAINKVAIDSISAAIALQKKIELGYTQEGSLANDKIVKKNINPLNLNQKC